MGNIVVVGAGQAAASLATSLRARGYPGSITMVGEEPMHPYERPPLSKAYLLGKLDRQRLELHPASFYAQNRIDVVTGVKVEHIDRRAKVVHGGRHFAYDTLVLATGSSPRRLPPALGGDVAGVHVVRTLADIDALVPACRVGARALVIGGGYIGLEAASVFASLGMRVTLVETADRILQRVAALQTSDHFRALHRVHGVDIREATGLRQLSAKGPVIHADLSDGTTFETDLVVVGIGVQPSVALAEAAGLEVGDGVVVDAYGRTSDPDIWAAGDCATFDFDGRRIRLESVQNAIDQAQAVAENILGGRKPYVPVPWFWSDQYDTKLQIAGLGHGYDEIALRPGKREGAVSHWYFRQGRLLAVDAINDPHSFMFGRRALERGLLVAPSTVADPEVDLRQLL